MLTVNFIGCGKLGKALALLFIKNRCAQILGVVNSTYDSSLSAVKLIGAGCAYHSLAELPKADVCFITTDDDQIKIVCDELIATNKSMQNTVILHCSGSLTSNALNAARAVNLLVASIHPVKSFAQIEMVLNSFAGTFCAFEGDAGAFPMATTLFESIGGKIFSIPQDKKSQYHAALSIANNYAVTLHFHAMKQLLAANIDEEHAKQLVSNLMTDAISNLSVLNHFQSLTGPIQRGDIDTIQGHLKVILNKVERDIYASLGRGTLELTSLSEVLQQKLQSILQ